MKRSQKLLKDVEAGLERVSCQSQQKGMWKKNNKIIEVQHEKEHRQMPQHAGKMVSFYSDALDFSDGFFFGHHQIKRRTVF